MEPTDDSALLRQFAENNSDDAFAALVTKYINLVYSVAMRVVGNPASAQEITQAVFIIMARKAGQLRNDKALSSWLFKTTQLTANNFLRSETRRQSREQEAHDMQMILNEPEPELWPRIAPLLDNAVAALNEKDRRAILLRFYEGKNLREIGNLLGSNESAAEKRVSRALEKLRKFFTKRGVSSTTEILAGTISAHSVQAAPVALAKSVTAVAIAKGSIAAASTITLVKGTLKIMTYIKLKLALGVAAATLLTAGVMTVALSSDSNWPATNPAGTWKWVAPTNSDGRTPDITFTLKLQGETLMGTRTTGTGTTTIITNGVLKGDVVSFQTPHHETSLPKGQISFTTYSGKLDGDTIKGTTEIFIDDKLFSSQVWEIKRVKK